MYFSHENIVTVMEGSIKLTSTQVVQYKGLTNGNINFIDVLAFFLFPVPVQLSMSMSTKIIYL